MPTSPLLPTAAHCGDLQALAAVWDRPSPQPMAAAADVEGEGGEQLLILRLS